MVKIPVKVVWIKDINNHVHPSIMIAMNEVVSDFGKVDYDSIKRFNKEYNEVISDCKEVLKVYKKKGRIQPIGYWKVGFILNNFVEQKESDFKFTNYRIAFQKDLVISDSYIGVIMDFPKFFEEREIVNEVKMSYYFELLLKARALFGVGKFNAEKKKLVRLEHEGKLPDHKTYRQMLKETLRN